jgi:hypothetical protein
MTQNIAVPIELAIVAYAIFGTFNAQAGGRINLGQASLALSHALVGRLRPTAFPDRMTTQLLT